MIDLNELNGEIEKLKNSPMSYGTIQKLAWLYTVRDHQFGHSKVECYGDSPCMRACAGKPIDQVMPIIDELMGTLQIIQPRLYDAVLERLA